MQKIFLFGLFVLFSQFCGAQATKTNGVSGKPVVLNVSDQRIPDLQPNLIHLDQYPLPASEYANRKELLNQQRNDYEAQKKSNPQAMKKRGLAPNPYIVKGIQGNTANGTPNDNDIAVSNAGKVVSVVNSNMRVYDDTGGIIVSKSLTNLVAGAGNYSWISDPRVLYDPTADRFVLVCFSGNLSTESVILVGFSQTPEPEGNWNFYALNGSPFPDSTWSDYPIIALSDKDLFMTFNLVKDNISWTVGFKQSVIWQIDKQTGYSGNPLQYTLWSDIKHNGIYNRNICPVKYQTSTMGNNMHFLTLRNVAASNDSIFLTEITDSYTSGNAALVQRVITTPKSYGFPPNARQKKVGGVNHYLMTNDARVLAAIYENDHIHFGSNTVNTQFMNAGVYLGTIANVSSTTPTVTAEIFSDATMEYGYPSMTWMGTGTNDHKVLYTFSHCITDSFPGTSILYKDANGNYSDIIAVKNGTSIINVLVDTNDRWGDYTNIQRQYNTSNRAYLSGSWGKSTTMNSWVSIVDHTDYPTSVVDVKEDVVDVFPNPVSDKRFTIRFELNESKKVKFELYDVNGRLVQKILDTRLKKGTHAFSVETAALTPGIYFLKLFDEKQLFQTEKLIVR
jgi:hypothetical protein